MKAWTDYPIEALGDKPGKEAPIRRCKVLDWDRDKYCHIEVDGVVELVKRGYLYSKPGRYREAPWIPRWRFYFIKRTVYS